jgi:hypothetical protein
MEDFVHLMLRFDPEDGTAEIRGREPHPGQRIVFETLNNAGERIYVLRKPGHSYSSLASRRYAPASFEVLAEDYPETHLGREEREDDRPWIKVRRVVSFPVSIGTKAGLR